MLKKNKLLIQIISVLLAVVLLAGLREFLLMRDEEEEASSGVEYAEMVKDNHPLLKEFRSQYPERTVLLACAEDITNDGIEDLVVISQLKKDIETIAFYSTASGEFAQTPPIPAPRENQHIRFFNMDKLSEFQSPTAYPY